ncbi:isoamylase early set domain-containing protein [Planctomycetota bacterium]
MSIKKKYLKKKKLCKVTFKLDKEAVVFASSVHLVGEFNNWDMDATPMKRLKDGAYTVTLELQSGRKYQFRYLIDKTNWENDWHADEYAPTPYGDSKNSVVIV